MKGIGLDGDDDDDDVFVCVVVGGMGGGAVVSCNNTKLHATTRDCMYLVLVTKKSLKTLVFACCKNETLQQRKIAMQRVLVAPGCVNRQLLHVCS